MKGISLLCESNNTMKHTYVFILMLVLIAGCSKKDAVVAISSPEVTNHATSEYTQYRILKGNHYCDISAIKAITLTEQNFKVKFDSTAVYKTLTEDNQFDINKLYGFSEGLDPHKNSARIGWSYNKDSLRLYGYVYNNSSLLSQEIATCKIGEVIRCSIRPDKRNYVFTVNDKSISLERDALPDIVQGYQLYPYFGGDEVAPHNINIFISVLPGK